MIISIGQNYLKKNPFEYIVPPPSRGVGTHIIFLGRSTDCLTVLSAYDQSGRHTEDSCCLELSRPINYSSGKVPQTHSNGIKFGAPAITFEIPSVRKVCTVFGPNQGRRRASKSYKPLDSHHKGTSCDDATTSKWTARVVRQKKPFSIRTAT